MPRDSGTGARGIRPRQTGAGVEGRTPFAHGRTSRARQRHCFVFFLVARLGADNILANLRMVGWGILLIIAAEILAFLANTLGWRVAFPRQGVVPSFGQLLLARIAGDGVNYLTPTATMGGEFVRVRMLQGQAPRRHSRPR